MWAWPYRGRSLFLLRSPCLFISFLCYPKCDRPRCVILARPAAAAPARRRYLRSWSELHSPDTEKKLAPKLTQDRTRAPAAGPAIYQKKLALTRLGRTLARVPASRINPDLLTRMCKFYKCGQISQDKCLPRRPEPRPEPWCNVQGLWRYEHK